MQTSGLKIHETGTFFQAGALFICLESLLPRYLHTHLGTAQKGIFKQVSQAL